MRAKSNALPEPKNNYWYRDNWTGALKYFETFGDAKQAASKETGHFIYIHSFGGYRRTVEASGHCPS